MGTKEDKRFQIAWLGVILMLGTAILAGYFGLGMMIAAGIFFLGTGLLIAVLSFAMGRKDLMITGAGAAGVVLGVFLILWDVLPKVTSGTVSFPLLAGATIVVLAVVGMVYVIGKK